MYFYSMSEANEVNHTRSYNSNLGPGTERRLVRLVRLVRLIGQAMLEHIDAHMHTRFTPV